MDLVVLDHETPTWLPVGKPLSRYSSLIWTERFFEPSDFQLITLDLSVADRLPVGTVVSERSSEEAMVVEKHVIERDANGRETLRIDGRSITSYIYHRTIGYRREQKYIMSRTYRPSAAALIVLYNSFVNDQAYDYTRAVAAGYKKPEDAIPNTVITDSSGINGLDGALHKRWIAAGYIDEPLKRFMSRWPFGLRIVRPGPERLGTNVITFDSAGVIDYTYTDPIPQLAFDMFDGEDRSHTQVELQPLVFDTETDDFIMSTYVDSLDDFKTMAHIFLEGTSITTPSLQPSEIPNNTRAGLDRRVLYLDGGTPEEGFTVSEWEDHNREEAQEKLEDHYRIRAMDGEVSRYSSKRYGVDYKLGDVVSVRGKYTPLARARVMEYTRSESETGVESYPTLDYI